MGQPTTSHPKALGLVATPILRVMNIGMAARSCHERIITK